MLQAISDLQSSVGNLTTAVNAAVAAGIGGGVTPPPSGPVLGTDDQAALSDMKSQVDNLTSQINSQLPQPAPVTSTTAPVFPSTTTVQPAAGDATLNTSGPPRT